MQDLGVELVRCERASLRHLSAIEGLEKKYFQGDAFSRRRIRYLLESPNATSFVATLKDEVIGYIIGVSHRGSGTGRIYTFCVREDYRGKNVASRLLMELESALDRKGINYLTLEVKEGNIAAYRFYTKSGFLEVGRLAGYYSDGSTAVKMEKSIGHPIIKDT